MNQRWRDRQASFRPAEPIRTAEYDVERIPDDRTARAFVERHHYSGTYPAARARFGLYRQGELAGVAVFSHPCNDRVLSIFPGKPADSIELGRFVLLDEVPGNGETWFLARCFEELRRDGLAGVVSFSDPQPRPAAGAIIFPGHVGTIYQAHNAAYLGRGTARTLRLLPDGQVLSDRAISKIRKLEKGWAYAAGQLERHGADPLDQSNPAAWLKAWLPRLTSKLRHRGNHKYAWMLQKRSRPDWERRPYPKMRDEDFPLFTQPQVA